ncbi:MAG TPA: ferrochelatase [Planctomycetota bacterium]|nr:ferrochelatase [Planctomycetota bacterium]
MHDSPNPTGSRPTGLLLVNLGTPDAPEERAVRRYLRQFLSDPRVLDVRPWVRAFVLNVLILPRRPRESARAYRSIWTERGSPLLVHTLDLAKKLRSRLGEGYHVEVAMRYGRPEIAAALERFLKAGIDRLILFPLFPQYSSSAWGSAVEEVFSEASRLWNVPAIQVIPPFYDHPAFLDAFAAIARPVLDELEPEKVLMSFHGLPERQILKSDPTRGEHCLRDGFRCCDEVGVINRYCYRAHCVATARGIAERLGLEPERFIVTFQSRLGRDPWIRPFTDEVVVELARAGTRRVAVLSPAFVADCLETLEELAIRAREDFIANGGEDLRLVPSLNAEDVWVEAMLRILDDALSTRLSGEASQASSARSFP